MKTELVYPNPKPTGIRLELSLIEADTLRCFIQLRRLSGDTFMQELASTLFDAEIEAGVK